MTRNAEKAFGNHDSLADRTNGRTLFLCHAATWYGLIFATPLVVALTNQQDIILPVSLLVPALAVLFILLSLVSWGLSSRLGFKLQKPVAIGMLSIAFMLAIQGNLLHTLTYFGQFDGSMVFFRQYGIWFWIEWFGFLAGFILFFFLFNRAWRVSAWLSLVPFLSFTLALGTAFVDADSQPTGSKPAQFNDTVFDFSNSRNLVHLLPDALQSDIVEQVLRENPELAMRFRGFTLYSDHLGLYYGTAPTLPALLTGRAFDFEKGHTYEWITPFIEENSYQNDLADNGYELDLVPIVDAYCVSRAKSCVPRPFSGWKSWGYQHYRVDSAWYSLRILADLTLYRLSPSFLKEKIYAGGEWMLADSKLDGASPWPDPVIREWINHMRVTEDAPHYKFYHYIGTHKPVFWTRDCRRRSGLAPTRENFLGQAQCILSGIASLLDKLREVGIYDQTAIIISGDHGHGIMPHDLSGSPRTVMLSKKMMGTVRPALLVKKMGDTQALKFSRLPTSVIDIAAIARSVAGVDHPVANHLDRVNMTAKPRDRYFYNYPLEKLRRWSTEPVAHDVYRVRGPANEDSSWELLNLQVYHPAPDQYPAIGHAAVAEYMRGVRVNPANPDQEQAWITRNQLAFLISIQSPGHQPQTLVLTLNIPDWIGEQSYRVRINETEIDRQFHIPTSRKYWQEVRIELPASSLKKGNNFVSLKFEKLQAAPKADLDAAAILRAVHME